LKVNEYEKKHIPTFIVISIAVILFPLFLSFGLKISWFSIALGNVESWIGFWGSYLGNIIGLLGLYYATTRQIIVQTNSLIRQENMERDRIYISIILENLSAYQKELSILNHELENYFIIVQDLISIQKSEAEDWEVLFNSKLEKHNYSSEKLSKVLSDSEIYILFFELQNINQENFKAIEEKIIEYQLWSELNICAIQKWTELQISEVEVENQKHYTDLIELVTNQKKLLANSTKSMIKNTLLSN